MTDKPLVLGRDALLSTVRQAIAASSPGLDAAELCEDTPLAALFFDSMLAVTFVATLECSLQSSSALPFEEWLREHAERTDALTVGALVDWLHSLPDPRGTGTAG
jgi:hypothetical protein